MPRKKSHTRHKKPIRHSHSAPESVKLLIGIFSVLLLSLGFLVFYKQAASFCANSVSCIKNLSGKYDTTHTTGVFMGKTVTSPDKSTLTFDMNQRYKNVLGDTTGVKHIYVDLAKQMLYAYQGSSLVMSFPISSGWWHLTPPGDYTIWIKLRATAMVGGDPAIGTYYNLPNVPWTMYLYSAQIPKTYGLGIHGAYWHNRFGHPMSHGCINEGLDNAAKLYTWADPQVDNNASTTYATDTNPGTAVTIYGTTPNDPPPPPHS